jgi:ethanolamine permease
VARLQLFAFHGRRLGRQDHVSMAAGGIFAALPFAIWFFAIEGVAMAAEEAKEPRRTIPSPISPASSLTVLAFGVMVPGGSGDWRSLANLNDPLPQAMKRAVGASSGWLHMLVWLGLFGLVASSGIIMGYARQIFALGRAGYLPPPSPPAPALQTPHIATLAGGMVGIATIYSDTLVQIAGQSLTASVVTLSAFGALTMYIVSMAALFRLRRAEPQLARPYSAPLYPLAPGFALGAAALALATMVANNRELAAIFAVLMVVMVGGSLLLRRTGEPAAQTEPA